MTNDKYDATHYGGHAKKKGLPAWAWVTIILGGLALLCGGAVAVSAVSPDPAPVISTPAGDPEGEGTLGSAPTKKAEPVAEEEPVGYKVGQAFRSGDFQYKIHGIKTGLTKVGGQYLSSKAQGQFVRLDLTVTNTGREAKTFDGDWYVKVKDTEGREFSADSEANIYGNEDAAGWLTEINPGNSIRAFVYFDLPKGATAKEALVAAGLFTFKADAVVTLR